MATTDLMVGIGAEYKGKAAFKKAEKDIFGLSAGVKTLAKAYIGLAGAQKAFRLGAQSLTAFAQDDKAARQLAKTVGNLGLAYEQTNVENFIAGLEKTYHVADDFLRPAFAKLVQVTHSYTKSKELLTAALNASAGAGVDLTTTVTDLSQAYVGNLKGLKKYNLGLTNAELATMTFEQILTKLNSTFIGQGALAADTYAGKIDALTIAAGNAKEVIGKGLVDAISQAFGNGDISQATKNIETMGRVVGDIIAGLGTAQKYSGFNLIAGVFGGLKKKRNDLATKDRKYDPMSGKVQDISPAGLKMIQQRAKADKEAAKRQKELAALAVKQTKAIKEQTALAKAKAILDKASAVMNMDLIQNTAALMGRIDDDQRTRLLLQQAILLGNSEEAGNLAQKLLATQAAALQFAGANPLDGWKSGFDLALEAIEKIRKALEALGAVKVPIPFYNPPATGGGGAPFVGTPFGQAGSFVDSMGTPFGQAGSFVDSIGTPFGQAGGNGTQTIQITIDPNAAAYGINAAVVGSTANGNLSQFNRTTNNW